MTEPPASETEEPCETAPGEAPLVPTTRRSFVRAGAAAGAAAFGATGSLGSASAQTANSPRNYAEALQKSLYFFDANRCGPGVTGGRLEWRGDCHETDTSVPLAEATEDGGTNLSQSFIDANADVLDPDGTGAVDLAGGFHDAGDHVKFGLPQSFSASTLAWAVFEFEDAFRETDSYDHVLDHLQWFADYFLKSTFRDADGNVVAFAYQGGEGDIDHEYWGPPELQRASEMPRPAYFAYEDDPASDQCAGAAAALAVISLVLEDDEADVAAEYLDTAEALYEFAVENRGLGYSGGFYDSSGDADELAWAAIWLHIATGEDTYLDDVVATDDSGNFTGHVGEIIATTDDEWDNTWVHSWDTVWSGVFLKLASETDDQQWQDIARWNLEYWTGGEVAHEGDSGNYVDTTPAGFSWLTQWGSARYNAAAQFQAAVYRKYFDTDHAVAITDWAKTQMEYVVGDNPFGYSLIVGFTDDHAEHPHHDAAHGSTSGMLDDPPEHRHTLWGALVGGPDDADNHNDETSDYTLNEVAIDFNAGLVGALAGHYTFSESADEPIAFSPDEPGIDPFTVEALLDGEDANSVQVEAYVLNDAIHPPRFEDGLSFRYFFDASGVIEAGGSVDDVSVSVYYDQQQSQYDGNGAEVVGPEPWDEDANLYYVEFDYAGHGLHGERELTFSLHAYANDGFDPTIDPSYQGIGGERARVETLPVYLDGELVFGQEPDGSGDDGGDDTTAPSAPSNLSVDATTASSIGVSWDASSDSGGSGLDSYVVSVDGSQDQTVAAGTTTATIDGLAANTSYEIGVSAVDGAGNESATTTVTATTGEGDGDEDTTAPSTPSNLSVTDEAPSAISVAWDAASDTGGSGLDHYDVTLDGSQDQQVSAGTTSATVSGLSPNTGYTVGVSAVDVAGNESSTVSVQGATDADDTGDVIAELDPSTTSASVGERVTFQVVDTSGSRNWITALDWTFGDGTTATGWWNAHSYSSAGTYTVALTATDNQGNSTTYEVTITVE